VLFTISSVLAGVACISSLLLLWFSLDSWRPGSVYQYIGLGGLSYGQITTSIYLKVSISDFLTLFSCRGGATWFWTTMPAKILMLAGGLALTCSTILACAWPESYPDGIFALGLVRRKPYALFVYIWIYCIVWWVVQDAAKVGTYWLLKRYNLMGINETGALVLPESTLRYIEEEKARRAAEGDNGPVAYHH
jgi:H+-transporting ATPase